MDLLEFLAWMSRGRGLDSERGISRLVVVEEVVDEGVVTHKSSLGLFDKQQ